MGQEVRRIGPGRRPLADGGRITAGSVAKGRSPERLIKFLDQLMKITKVNRAAEMAGFSKGALRYYLQRSKDGKPGDGYDLTYGEETKRFHEHYADTIDYGIQETEDELKWRALKGYEEQLHDKGRVIYRIDPSLANLGLTGPDAYLCDENNRPIPESIHHQDPELMLAVLRAFRKERWGQKTDVDVNVRGGVMVVGVRAKPKEVEEGEQEALTAPMDVEFREVKDEVK
jgi:hypothetical protein